MPIKAKTCTTIASLVLLFLSSTQSVFANSIGLVQRVERAVYGTEPQGNRIAKHSRDGIVSNELIETTKDSAIQIRFIDGSKLLIGEDANVTIDNFVFDTTAGNGAAALTMTHGAFRWVTGVMPKGGVTLETPTASISIRGTDLKLSVRPNGDTLLSLIEGEIAILAKSGGDAVILNAGQSARVTPQGAEVIKGIISVTDAVIDSNWSNTGEHDTSSSRSRDSGTPNNGNNGGQFP